MTVSSDMISQLRRMVNEPTNDPYTDEILTAIIDDYPLIDERGEAPYTWDTSTTPPTQDENEDWIDTYDLHAAAARVWEEKATAWADKYDFSADGGQFVRHQAYDQCIRMAKHHNARRAPRNIRMFMWPEPTGAAAQSRIANLKESD